MTADIGFVLQGTETPHFDVGILPNVAEKELQAPLHRSFRPFAEGIADDMRPAESARETAALIVEAATEKAVAREIEVDDDGALSI